MKSPDVSSSEEAAHETVTKCRRRARPTVDDSVVVLNDEKVYLGQMTETDTDNVHIQIS